MAFSTKPDNDCGTHYPGLPKAHPASPAGAGGPGAFRMPPPLGIDLEFGLGVGRRPGPIGCDALTLGDAASDPTFLAAPPESQKIPISKR
jgi:hypothetical protein